mmetsp:Transcript_5344/g.11551  ORF Transcript_5344/g.11551 Transcript_5344/m.11551 type:complete len:228 (-) Transcript_5344:322-1005(-)
MGVHLVEALRVPPQQLPDRPELAQHTLGHPHQHRGGAGGAGMGAGALFSVEYPARMPAAHVLGYQPLSLNTAIQVHVPPSLALDVGQLVELTDLLHQPRPLHVLAHPVDAVGWRPLAAGAFQLAEAHLGLDGFNQWAAGLPMDRLDLLQRRHLKPTPGPVKIHQRPLHVIPDPRQREGLQRGKIPFQLVTCGLENILQGLALVQHGVAHVILLAVQHVGGQQSERSE